MLHCCRSTKVTSIDFKIIYGCFSWHICWWNLKFCISPLLGGIHIALGANHPRSRTLQPGGEREARDEIDHINRFISLLGASFLLALVYNKWMIWTMYKLIKLKLPLIHHPWSNKSQIISYTLRIPNSDALISSYECFSLKRVRSNFK